MRLKVAVVAVALLICAGMYVYAPYIDAVLDPGPIYAPLWSPPKSVNEGHMSINWPVLQGQWLVVGLLGGIVLLALGRWTRHNIVSRCVLMLGAATAICSLVYPPVVGGGPLGIHVGRELLFHHGRETELNVQLLDLELATVFFVTATAYAVVKAWNRVADRRKSVTTLENA